MPVEKEIKPKEAMVQMKKSDIDYLMNEIKALREAQKESKILINAIADKGRLAKYNENNQGPKEQSVKLSTIDGKIVTSWTDLTENFVGKNENGIWSERHSFDIQFSDGEKKHLTLREFNSKQGHVDGIIKKSYQNEDLKNILEIDVNGKLYKIESRFINR